MTLHLWSEVLECLFPAGSQEAFQLLLTPPLLKGLPGRPQAGPAPCFTPIPLGVSSTWLDRSDTWEGDAFLTHLSPPLRDHHRLDASRLAAELVNFSLPT